MEPVQNVDGLSGFLGDDFQVRPPHVTADKLQRLAAFLTKPTEELQQCFDRTFLTDPQQPFAVSIDLVDQGQIPVAALPGDFVYTNGLNAR